MWKIFHHWGLPLVGAVCWSGMLIALITCWAVQGHPRYDFLADNKNIVFISDVAATNLQPIFISCASVEAICYVCTMVSERYLRHAGRLLPNYRKTEKVLSGLSIGFGVIGQVGIICVSCFNTVLFTTVHMTMLCVFLGGVGISAFLTICEFVLLDRAYKEVNHLRISYSLKALWFITALSLAIAFGVESLHGSKNVAAVLEWCLALSWGFYLLTLVYDLLPAAKTPKGQLLEKKLGNELTRVASWVPGMSGVSEDDDHEMYSSDNYHLGDTVYTERNHHNQNINNNNHNNNGTAEPVFQEYRHPPTFKNSGHRQQNSIGYKHRPAEIV